MKRKKIKKKPIIILIILIIGSITFVNLISSKNEKEKKEPNEIKEEKVDLVNEIYNKLVDMNIDKDFLIWINEKYPNSLQIIEDYLNNNEYNQGMWHLATGYSYIVLNDLYKDLYNNSKNIKIIDSNEISILSFVGDVSLADNWYIMPEYDKRNKNVLGILSESVLDIMKNSELMVVNSEFTVSNRGTAMKGKQYTFRAKPERLKIYDEMGVDLVTLANNHTYDFGKDAFLDMLDAFEKYNIPHIGAGHNLKEASEPYYFIINGYKFGFLNATRAEKYILTPGATETTEGVFRCYDPTNMINKIKEVKSNSDYVIAIIHFGKEGSHELEKEQVASAKQYIDAGADAIIGHHAHVLQGFEFYKEKPIIYNLGDFIFNGNTEDTAIFQIKLEKNGEMSYYIIPALQKNKYTDVLSGAEKERIIKDLNNWSVNAYIDSNGLITKKE